MKIITVRKILLPMLCASSVILGACASYDTPRHQQRGREIGYTDFDERSSYGSVTHIDVMSVKKRNTGGGALLGAILGAAIGHQVGDGDGRRVATGVGAVGGAIVGNNIERGRRNEGEMFRVRVRTNNGREMSFDYERIGDLSVGDRVRIEDGQIYRM